MKKIYIRTFGWPMDAVLYDYSALFEQDLVKRTMERMAEALVRLAE